MARRHTVSTYNLYKFGYGRLLVITISATLKIMENFIEIHKKLRKKRCTPSWVHAKALTRMSASLINTNRRDTQEIYSKMERMKKTEKSNVFQMNFMCTHFGSFEFYYERNVISTKQWVSVCRIAWTIVVGCVLLIFTVFMLHFWMNMQYDDALQPFSQ